MSSPDVDALASHGSDQLGAARPRTLVRVFARGRDGEHGEEYTEHDEGAEAHDRLFDARGRRGTEVRLVHELESGDDDLW